MDIRALVTVLGFRLDESGLKQYETAVTKIKGLAMEAGKMFGLYFAIDKIGEYASEIVKAGREMGRLNAQIAMLARSGDNAQAATDALFETAQKLGLEYKDIAETYKGFLVDTQDSKISQEELLTATENVYKALRVGRNNAEEMGNAIQAIERGLRLGRFDRRSIGRIIETPGLQQLLLSASGAKNIDALRDLAKQGKITGEQMIEWLSKPNAQLQADFEKMPKRIDWVFNQIKNTLASGTAELWKMSNGFAALGNVIWFVFNKAVVAIKWTVNALGGLQSTLQLVGIAMAVVLGPYMIRQAILMTAQFVEMAIASWTIWAPWIAIGAALFFVVGMIQDFYLWMTNPKAHTILGDLVGGFDDFKKKIEDMPIVKLATALADFATGDFTGGIKKLTEALGDPKKLLDEILALVAVGIPIAFIGWEALKFTGILSALGTLGKTLTGIKTQAVETGAAVAAVGEGKAGAGAGAAAATGAGAATAAGPRVAATLGPGAATLKAVPYIGLAITTAEILKALADYTEEKYHVTPKEGDTEGWSNVPFTRLWWKKKYQQWTGGPEVDPTSFAGAPSGYEPGEQPPREPGSGRAGGPVLGMTDMAQLMQMLSYGSMPWDVGAMAKTPVAPQITQSLTVAPVISVTTPDEASLAALIEQRVTTAGNNILEQASRQIQFATPRIEAPTQ